MRQFILIIACILLILNIIGCGQRDKSKVLAQYKYEGNTGDLTKTAEKKLEPWVKEGISCWGIIMVINDAGTPLRMKEVHVKVTGIQSDSIQLQALEDVTLGRSIECSRVSFKKGDRWKEEYGDLFKTRKEAIQFIDAKYPGLRVKQVFQNTDLQTR